ncbi:MAG: carboxymuconolactone decarboxylase family protein [Deltaproteobacteria bacterium]
MFLQLQGQDPETVAAIRRADLDHASIAPTERVLLGLVKLLTQQAYRCQDEDVEIVRQAGWTDPQIAEAVYITALFAFFNRVADAFGLQDPHYELMANPPRPNPVPYKSGAPGT